MQWAYSVGKYETINTKCKNSEARLRNIFFKWYKALPQRKDAAEKQSEDCKAEGGKVSTK